uniref:Uncharacterized protein n=1 Tax=Anopheles culicifacies TaxID=139723 RepID=A0A182LUS4_9DIPT
MISYVCFSGSGSLRISLSITFTTLVLSVLAITYCRGEYRWQSRRSTMRSISAVCPPDPITTIVRAGVVRGTRTDPLWPRRTDMSSCINRPSNKQPANSSIDDKNAMATDNDARASVAKC